MVLTNKEDSTALLLEAEQQGLMNGDYVFFLVQHFEVSGGVVSKTLKSYTFSGVTTVALAKLSSLRAENSSLMRRILRFYK